MTAPAVQETLAQLKYMSIDYDRVMEHLEWAERPILDGSEYRKCVLLKFKSKSAAKRARRRIIEEQHGGQWPPFAVHFAAASPL